jgi:hypothetical protein
MGDILFRPLAPAERDRLRASLRRNAGDGASLLTGLDTSFVADVPELPAAEEVIRAIKSVPCHYADFIIPIIAPTTPPDTAPAKAP